MEKKSVLKGGITYLSLILQKVNMKQNHRDAKYFSFLREQKYEH